MDVVTCTRCNTPLDEASACVTCAAEAEGLKVLTRSGYASVKEMMEILEDAGLAPAIEQVPPRRPEERSHPVWNLYAPEAQVQAAAEVLRSDWAHLLEGGDAASAAARGMKGVDLDGDAEIECPACGHAFRPATSAAECPDCGLALGAPAEGTP